MSKVAVTAVCWVPKGRCKPRAPEGDHADDEELKDAHAAMRAGGGARASSSAVNDARAAANAVTAGLEEFDMDNYDDEPEDGMQFFSVLDNDGPLLLEKDPHLQEGGDSDSEPEFYEIAPQDQVFMAVSCNEENCQLELMVYAEEEASMYVHHDIVLGAYPLCVEWISEAGTAGTGSYAAIGLIDNCIQIWDLEDVEPVEPLRALGVAKKPAKGKKKRGPNPSSVKAHDGAVLCLHGSVFNRNVLASGSADETLKVWDVRENKCVHTYTHHKDKVQCARWHPTEQAVLLSAAFDRRLGLLDVRQPNQAALCELPAEAESTIWRRHAPFECLASVDNGGVACYDVRKIVAKDSKAACLWEIDAHDVACTSVQDCPTQNCFVTCGLDGHAKVWNLDPRPMCVFDKDLQAGPLFTCMSCPEAPATFCLGGKCPVMWDLASESVLCGAFGLNPQAEAQAP